MLTIRSVIVPAACLAAVLTHAEAARAAVVLKIDITNPTSVVFESTDAPSLVTRSSNGDTILMAGLLTSGPSSQARVLTGTLKAAQGSFTPNFFFVPSNFVPELSGNGNLPYTFVTGLRALSGSSQADLSSWTFQSVGFVGDVVIRDADGNSTGLVVGQYQIVPAPGAAALLGLGGLMSTGTRRRR